MALRTWEITFTKISGPGPAFWRCEFTAHTKDEAIHFARDIAKLTAGVYQEGSHWHYTAVPILWGPKKGEMIQ